MRGPVRQGWKHSFSGYSSLRYLKSHLLTPILPTLYSLPHTGNVITTTLTTHTHTTFITKYNLLHLHRIAHISLWMSLPSSSPLSSLGLSQFLPSSSFLHITTKELIQKYKYFHTLCKFQWFREQTPTRSCMCLPGSSTSQTSRCSLPPDSAPSCLISGCVWAMLSSRHAPHFSTYTNLSSSGNVASIQHFIKIANVALDGVAQLVGVSSWAPEGPGFHS